LRFRYAPPTAGHSAGGWNALTIKTDHPVGADHLHVATTGTSYDLGEYPFRLTIGELIQHQACGVARTRRTSGPARVAGLKAGGFFPVIGWCFHWNAASALEIRCQRAR
ncbi:MAG: hypothetical protein RL274_2878, partial [Pseudomonadota bacterium]